MIRRLIILLLIVGCDKDSTSSDINPLLGKWKIIESTNTFLDTTGSCNFFFVDTFIEITVDTFIWVSEQIGMDENGNYIGNWFSATNFNYTDNNPNLILLYESEELNKELHFIYEVNDIELKLQHSLKIQNGDTTNCTNYNSNTIATSVTDIPETTNNPANP